MPQRVRPNIPADFYIVVMLKATEFEVKNFIIPVSKSRCDGLRLCLSLLRSLPEEAALICPRKCDPDEGARPPGLYDLDVSVERRQPIEESAPDGRSVCLQ